MDMRIYYRKVHEIEQQLTEAWVVVKSLETQDGGKGGVLTEVSRRNAAILITDGKAQLASTDEAQEFRDKAKRAKLAADRDEAARRVQMSLVSTSELEALKGGLRPVTE